ncbi:MAG: hypothetical protein JNJ88_05190 [Planctomycetes bacterium]|nr:hypothetical protein [Planctomycetota bacterium]
MPVCFEGLPGQDRAPDLPESARPDSAASAAHRSARRRRPTRSEKKPATKKSARERTVTVQPQAPQTQGLRRPLGPIPADLLPTARRREMLEWVLSRDGEAIQRLVAAALQREALVLSPAAVSLRVFGRLAATFEGSIAWDVAVERAIEHAVRSTAADSLDGHDDDLTPPGQISLLGSELAAQTACRAFNRLPTAQRHALYRVAVLGESPQAAASHLGESPEVVAERARLALLTVLEGATRS